MNKKIALSSLAFAIMLPASIAFAQDEQQEVTSIAERGKTQEITETNREQTKQNMEVKREENKQLAEENREASKLALEAKREEKKLEFEDKKEKMEATKCKNIENKIATRFKRYENNGRMLQTVYGNMQSRLTRLLARLNTAGADTTKLTTDMATLDVMIEKLYTDQSTFMTTLQESQAFVCGKSEGEFKNKLEGARKVPELIKQDREDIKNFFQANIKADLQAIRTLLADQKEEVEISKTPKTPKVEPAPAVNPASGPTL